MAWKSKAKGSMLAFVGFMLSPLSWWNDMFVNVPLALAAAWLVGLIYKPAFGLSFVVAYWLTNVLGFVLMHKGARALAGKEAAPYTKHSLLKDVGISLLYTLVIVVLVRLGILKPLQNYFG
jgi:hypothetical protein